MNITATHINYYHICHRKLWLFTNGISMEQTSDTVADGKLLHETSYQQRADRYREIELSFTLTNHISLNGKIDFYDVKNKLIHETKRSDKMETAHEWQVKFYIYLLSLNGSDGVKAILEYPRIRTTKEVSLSEEDIQHLQEVFSNIQKIASLAQCPERINSTICKSCSYYELCYVGD
ncbi:MAG: CRISPR-associated protein Cas4 [Bacteroidetes bacterium]|nr:CRISPR-associated protein Cas4 [Bacteroidota bacterium]